MEFHDNYPEYEKMSNHDEAYGKKARRTLWNVFWIMLVITIVELIIGFMAPSKGWSGTLGLKVLFIGLTIVKAAAIVLWFMHLGHEVKFFKYVVLLPYAIFMLYTIFIVLTEGTYSGEKEHYTQTRQIPLEDQLAHKKAHGGGHHGGGESHGESSHEGDAHH
ncbi:MAG: cytochrome C oxidase subunit IV family protein [Bacteroidota bacterium]|jgi:caa(3)-type oxidase subunit IV|nr:cytochrome C oxidase subunit IV family protein [Bacteroidota bacterium]MCA6444846.1 cytochrome C oxidase subunit IV family protein [Bacteroidota bacterium]